MLSPRRGIRKQTLDSYPDQVERFAVSGSAFSSRVQIETVHKIGCWYRLDYAYPKPRLVIIDEFHTLFSETHFSRDLIYFYQQLLEWVDDPSVTLIALTATTALPLEFVNQQPFKGFDWLYQGFQRFRIRKISRDLDPPYKAKVVQIESGKSLETILRGCPASPDNKQLVFVRGTAAKLVSLAEGEDRSAWLCSEESKREVNGIKAAELMNRDHLASILGGYLPEGVDRIYLTSAYREGINILDEAVQEVIIEGASDIELVQALGRVRHPIRRLIIVIDSRKFQSGDRKIREALDLLEGGDLEAYFGRQEKQDLEGFEGERIPNLVFRDKYTRGLRFNYLALCYWLFDYYSSACATQQDWKEIELAGRSFPSRKEYFSGILDPYSESAITYDKISYGKPSVDRENAEKLDCFDWKA